MPHPAQPRHTYWAPRTRKRHQQKHRPQRPTQRSDPTQHAKGRTGDCPGPRKETTTRRNVTQGGGGGGTCSFCAFPSFGFSACVHCCSILWRPGLCIMDHFPSQNAPPQADDERLEDGIVSPSRSNTCGKWDPCPSLAPKTLPPGC